MTDQGPCLCWIILALLLLGAAPPGQATWQQDPPPTVVLDPALQTASDAEQATVTPEPVEFTIPHGKVLGLPARVAALLMSGQQGGELAMALLAVPLQAADETLRVAFVIDVDISRLPLPDPGTWLPLELFVYAVTERGGVGGHLARAFSLPVTSALTERGGLKLLGEIEASPTPRFVRVLLRHPASGTFGLREVRLASDGSPTEQAFLSPPLLAEPPEAWVLGRFAGSEPDGAPDPFAFPGERILPATRPLLASDGPVSFWLLAQGLNPAVASLTARLLDRSGEVLDELEAAVLERHDSALEGVEVVRATVAIPALGPGLYELAVSASSAAADDQLHSSIPIIVGAGETITAWTQLDTAVGRQPPPPALTAPARRESRRSHTPRLRLAYLAALAQLVEGGRAAARHAVFELETSWLDEGGSTAIAELGEAELGVARSLAKRDPECALALALLHMELFHAYSAGQATLPRHHARNVVGELTSLLASVGGSPLARSLAANVAASVAGTLMEQRAVEASEALYRRALTIEPSNEAALIGLATSRERSGAYDEVDDLLEILVQAHPDNAEGRLRLAVNRFRLYDRKGARSLLDRCTEASAPAWIRSLAYQELARDRIDSDSLDEAHEVLLRARGDLPDDSTLAIQHAYVLDRLGQPFESRTLINALPSGAQRDRVSPRLRYSNRSMRELTEARRTLASHSDHAHAALQRALANIEREKAN